eukprot:gene3440-3907_t
MEYNFQKNKSMPLAEKMRPTSLEEFVGQSELLDNNTLLTNILKSGDLPSFILWGPPGCGKTTLARLVARNSNSSLVMMSAVTAGVQDIKKAAQDAANNLIFGKRTLLFIDEIHRFSKLQQDSLLPHVENGNITLVGATTENPSFELNSALLSRCRVFVLKKLTSEEIAVIIKRAIETSNQFSTKRVIMHDETIEALSVLADGDARAALNVIDIALKSIRFSPDQEVVIGKAQLGALMQKNTLMNDKKGDSHYNLISALHKCIRGSDANAACYYITRMLEGGSDPLFIARRMVRMASEDIGLADPMALGIATAGFQAVQFVGMPECSVNLLQVAVYLALAPKSNSLEIAYAITKEFLMTHESDPVPLHICNAPTTLMSNLGYGAKYQYNHDFEHQSEVTQTYLPESIKDKEFFKYKQTCRGLDINGQPFESFLFWAQPESIYCQSDRLMIFADFFHKCGQRPYAVTPRITISTPHTVKEIDYGSSKLILGISDGHCYISFIFAFVGSNFIEPNTSTTATTVPPPASLSSPTTTPTLTPVTTTSHPSMPTSASSGSLSSHLNAVAAPVTIESALASLSDQSMKKKALFDLKDLLKDEASARRFVERDGIKSIEEQLGETGNTLAYALSAIQTAMHFDVCVAAIPKSMIFKILSMLESSNPSITKTALSILSIYCISTPKGYEELHDQFKHQKKQLNASHDKKSLNSVLVSLLSSSTVDIQLNALTLINSLIIKSGLEFVTLLNDLDSLDIGLKLKKLFESAVSQELKKQLYYYQKHKLSLLKNRKGILYNKESQEHEGTLMKLWTTTYPDTKLESRVSEQWKLLGFQGTDPATDFRGMGIFGLENLVYFATAHTDTFRKIVNGQLDRKERDYPVAVAGINLTQMFFELFKVTEENNPEMPIFPILFSHKNAFEEVYCIAFQLLDVTWDNMNASYMEFPKVIATVKQAIVTALDTKPTTLEAFNWAAGSSKKSNNFHHEDDSMQSEDIKKLKQTIKKEIHEIVAAQKISILTDGLMFKLLKPIKGKTAQTPPHTHMFVKLSADQLELQYAYVTEPVQTIPPEKITTFSGSETIEMMANSREDQSNFIDAIKCLTGKQVECPETIEEYKTLVSLSMKLKLLDLEGIVELPKTPPKVPELPPDCRPSTKA